MKLYKIGNPNADIVLIQSVDDHDLEGIENEVSVIAESCGRDFFLIACQVEDWNKDLSPWKAPAVFGKEDFGDGAEETLRKILALCSDEGKTYYIGGYSLAGLFALWAAFQTDRFSGVAAASPSVWFPGFLDYMKKQKIQADSVYLIDRGLRDASEIYVEGKGASQPRGDNNTEYGRKRNRRIEITLMRKI